jgi:predicted nucleotidyltransferase
MSLINAREQSLKEIFDALEQAFAALDIDYYLIGAVARDVWYAKTGANLRKTKDVDFAVLIGSVQQYNAVREFLKNHNNFIEHKGNAFVLMAPSGVHVDILPFGEISIDGHVNIEGTGLTNISVDGFQEVLNSGTAGIEIETGHHFKVATLPAIVLLKLIAFDDRPEKRYKDARDIANIIGSYFDLQADLIYNSHSDLFLESEEKMAATSLPEISATVIGREIKRIAQGNLTLINRLDKIVEQHITLAEDSSFIRNVVEESGETVIETLKWINALLKGLRE